MIEIKGNLWKHNDKIILITTNGTIKNNGEAVMGRGCALEAKNKYPELSRILGNKLKNNGNHVYVLIESEDGIPEIISFPVKNDWRDKADLNLIEQSCKELIELDKKICFSENKYEINYHEYVIPRPGCGYGGLDWKDVKPILEKYLDDRFVIISF